MQMRCSRKSEWREHVFRDAMVTENELMEEKPIVLGLQLRAENHQSVKGREGGEGLSLEWPGKFTGRMR